MRSIITIPYLLLFITLFIASSILWAQPNKATLSPREISATIDSINLNLRNLYVYPEVANEMADLLTKKLQQGQYHSFSDPIELAQQLTIDLQSINQDRHLQVQFDPKGIARERSAKTATQLDLIHQKRLAEMKRQKFGFERVKRLEGNVGYLNLRAFMDTTFAAEAAHKAMKELLKWDAVIIDLRENHGGSPTMIQLLSSYFFSESTHLNSFYFRPTDAYSESWTLPHIPGKRRPDVALYLVTSSGTFSAAEEFAYNLKQLKRATIIGETTMGGAHPGGTVTVSPQFRVWIPQGRAINPITQTNWEGTGVTPDIRIAADEALIRAHIEALENLKNNSTNAPLIDSYSITIDDLQSRLSLEETKYADVLVDAKFKKFNDQYDRFYGGNASAISIDNPYMDPKAVLGNNRYYISIPKGSYVVVQFTDNLIIDVPNQDDIFIDETGRAGDKAEIHVSSDGKNYQLLGIASGGRTNSLDLADINFKDVVTHLSIVGLDTNGTSPGFDVRRIYGLPLSNIDKFVAEEELNAYLADPNDFQRRVLLKPVLFAFNSSQLEPPGMAYLSRLAKLILKYPDLKFRIIGHTDNIGTEEINDQLSKRRAKSVYDYLIRSGLDQRNLTYEGRGAREPLVHNDTAKGRKRNRRVELVKVD